MFDEHGQPRGVFNDATAAAVIAFKTNHQLGSAASANREVVLKMIELLEDRARGRGAPSAFGLPGMRKPVPRKQP